MGKWYERFEPDGVLTARALHKEFGKAKVFWTDASRAPPPSADEARALDAELAAATSARAASAAEIARLQAKVKAAGARKSAAQMRDEEGRAKAAAQKAEAERDAAAKEFGGGGAAPLTAAEEAAVKKDYGRMRKCYLDRRRACMEMVGHVGDGMGVPDKKVMEKMGLETDEEYGVAPKNFPPIA